MKISRLSDTESGRIPLLYTGNTDNGNNGDIRQQTCKSFIDLVPKYRGNNAWSWLPKQLR